MRKTYLLLLVGSLATAACSEDKYVLDTYSTMRYDALALPSPADTATLRAVDFVSANEGFVGGRGGTLFATTDGGQTWLNRSRPTLSTINKLLFTSASAGWAGTDAGLFRTSNGGQTWQPVSTADVYGYGVAVQDIDFVTPLVGYLVGSGGGLCKTTNGGTTWLPLNQRRDKRQLLRTVSFCSPDSGMVMGDDLTRWTTTDGGRTWAMYDQYQNTPSTGTTYDLLYQGPTDYQQAKIDGFAARDAAHGYDLADDEDYHYSLFGLASTGRLRETVAVGDHTIIRYHEGFSQREYTPWTYVHAADGTSFQDTYYAADFADASTFYAVGAHGVVHRFHYH